MQFVHMRDIRITDPLFQTVMTTIKEKMIPYQWEIINDRVEGAEKSHCIKNFKITAGEATGNHGGVVFLDTDVYKWLEAVAYSLIVFPDTELEALADDTIALIGRAQQPDGYLNTYFTIVEPEKRWKNLFEGHELYSAGHMMEAAVAYHQATGKTAFLTIARRVADNIEEVFIHQGHKGYPGHQEIELALFRLAKETGENRYADLARHFLDVRGVGDNYFEWEVKQPGHRYFFPEFDGFGADYSQSHAPVREQKTAIGHAVRAMYMYCAMADAALITGEKTMREACEALYDDVVHRQMYITGALGASSVGERFTSDYDLPNDMMYGETCASIGLMRFSARMFQLNPSAEYFAVWERAMRNTVMDCMNKEGNRFFYVNPMETDPERIRWNPTLNHVKPTRQKWFGVACCPTNLARTMLSFGGELYASKGSDIYILAQIPSIAEFEGRKIALSRDGDDYTLKVEGAPCVLHIRLPEGAQSSLPAKDGFIHIEHGGEEKEYHYSLRIEPRLMWANPRVAADAGKCAICEGGVVYCLESIDNGDHLQELYIDEDTEFEIVEMDFLPPSLHGLKLKGYRAKEDGWADALYSDKKPVMTPCDIIAIPYSQWNNRGEGEMRVWQNVCGGNR